MGAGYAFQFTEKIACMKQDFICRNENGLMPRDWKVDLHVAGAEPGRTLPFDVGE
ncbi:MULTISPECIES: hypothetical protein [Pseudomonas]|uniref:hypothetical protein n=1 Tax=Pseudomonas sp. NY5710 TaxID=2662033 RepID=UPI0015703CD2|nr:hypothetical protein [Pseudomonas sp. NY5710]